MGRSKASCLTRLFTQYSPALLLLLLLLLGCQGVSSQQQQSPSSSSSAAAAAANVPTAVKKAARGAARGATDAIITSVSQSNSDAPINYGDGSTAREVAIGAATGAMEGVSSSSSSSGVSVSQPRARSDTSLSLMDKLFTVALRESNMTDSQKAAAKRVLDGTLTRLNTSIEINCAWQVSVDAKTFNIAFPDGYAVYNVLMVPKLAGPLDVVRIQGQFPYVRYFSFQSYDPQTLEPVASLRDYQITPLIAGGGGTNPFATPPPPATAAADQKKNAATSNYQVHVTLRGDMGYPNELATVRPGSNDTGAFVLLRLYSWDPTSPNKTSLWGAVPPPVVSYKLYQAGGGGVWMNIDQCTENNTRDAAKALNAMAMAIKVSQASSAGNDPTCASYNQDNNFRLFQRTGSRAPFINKEAAYILACGNANGLQQGADLVAVVRGSMPASPYGLWSPIYVADATKYNARYVSLSAYDLMAPGPNLATLSDADMSAFYGKLYGSSKGASQQQAWQDKAARRYTVVMAANRAVAQRCRLLGSDTMFLQSSSSGLGPGVQYPGLVLREILAQSDRFAGGGGGGGAAISHASIHDVMLGCGEEASSCATPAYAKSVMGGTYYPSVTWYECRKDGTLKPAPTNTTTSSSNNAPTAATSA